MSDETLAGLNYALKVKGLSAKSYKVMAISEGFSYILILIFNFKRMME